MNKNNWKLIWGIHKGTMSSREEGEPVNNLNSLDECRAKAEEKQKQFGKYGYKLWYATAISPIGGETRFDDLCSPYIEGK